MMQDAARGVAKRFDWRGAGIEDGKDAAWTGLEALIPPRERADDAALAQYKLQAAAEILGMQQSFLERVVVEWKHVIPDFPPRTLTHEFEASEKTNRWLAHRFPGPQPDVGTQGMVCRFQRVIAGAGVHAEPFDPVL